MSSSSSSPPSFASSSSPTSLPSSSIHHPPPPSSNSVSVPGSPRALSHHRPSIFDDVVNEDELTNISLTSLQRLIRNAHASSIAHVAVPLFDFLDEQDKWKDVEWTQLLMRKLNVVSNVKKSFIYLFLTRALEMALEQSERKNQMLEKANVELEAKLTEEMKKHLETKKEYETALKSIEDI
ncbi:hypothetical protein HMI54_013502 [Coelomomyces lativittatus]|nr:hypothetical protein HMI54_013502 [Coelomomyces lativittatus]